MKVKRCMRDKYFSIMGRGKNVIFRGKWFLDLYIDPCYIRRMGGGGFPLDIVENSNNV
jgi:hypothetical protein